MSKTEAKAKEFGQRTKAGKTSSNNNQFHAKMMTEQGYDAYDSEEVLSKTNDSRILQSYSRSKNNNLIRNSKHTIPSKELKVK